MHSVYRISESRVDLILDQTSVFIIYETGTACPTYALNDFFRFFRRKAQSDVIRRVFTTMSEANM